jgi:hypothetical protein
MMNWMIPEMYRLIGSGAARILPIKKPGLAAR